jgi:hypothetical protein
MPTEPVERPVEQLAPTLAPGTSLSPKDAADYLTARGMRTTSKTVGRWMSEGKLAHTQTPGGHRFVTVAELDRVLAAGRRPATSTPGLAT